MNDKDLQAARCEVAGHPPVFNIREPREIRVSHAVCDCGAVRYVPEILGGSDAN